MCESSEREKEALNYHNDCLSKLESKPIPKGQKYKPGTRVYISDKMPLWMEHFEHGVTGTIEYSYTQMFMDTDHPAYNDLENRESKTYSINIDHVGSVSWYPEQLLMEIKEND